MDLSTAEIRRIKSIGEKLVELRVKAGYTSAENFAFNNDINRVQYWRMESGNNFTMASLLRVLNIHKITLEEFFKGLK